MIHNTLADLANYMLTWQNVMFLMYVYYSILPPPLQKHICCTRSLYIYVIFKQRKYN